MPTDLSRRGFLQSTAAAAAVTTLSVTPAVHAAGGDTLKLALIGAGGRGTGAARNALEADPNVKLVAVADVFEDRATGGLKIVKDAFPDKCAVTPDHVFAGFDAYKAAIDAADVVILATPPAFRPVHLAYAVEKGKHIFMEKPHATDVAGAKSVIASAKLAQQKGLGLVSGFTYRYDPFKREVVKRIHGGQIGDVNVIHTTFLTNELWVRPSKTNDPAQMEYQLRMWYYFTWLSGDHIVEQACHNIDKAHWLMNGQLPVSATGMGGRQVRTDPKFGNIWDHFTVVYDYASGARVFLQCRQQNNTQGEITDQVFGTKGTANLMRHTIDAGGDKWKHPGTHDLGLAYLREHEELFAGIRSGKPVNDGVVSAHSTLMALLGREAAYTGQRITWANLMKSNQTLVPTELAWGEHPVPAVAKPGVTKFA